MVKEKGVEFRNTTVIGPGVTHSYFSSEREREREREKAMLYPGVVNVFLIA